MALLYTADDHRLLDPGATSHPPKKPFKHDIHPRAHHIDDFVDKLYKELIEDRVELHRILKEGNQKAEKVAKETLNKVKIAIGLYTNN